MAELIGAGIGGEAVSVAHQVAPAGWTAVSRTPDFDEVTLVLSGLVRVTTDAGDWDVPAGQAVTTRAGERFQVSVPGPDGAEYVAICYPAAAPDLGG